MYPSMYVHTVCLCMYPSVYICVCICVCIIKHARLSPTSSWPQFHAQKEGKSYPTRLSDWPPSHGGERASQPSFCAGADPWSQAPSQARRSPVARSRSPPSHRPSAAHRANHRRTLLLRPHYSMTSIITPPKKRSAHAAAALSQGTGRTAPLTCHSPPLPSPHELS